MRDLQLSVGARSAAAAEVLAISRRRFYELVAEGRIRTLEEGAQALIRRCELERYLDALESRGGD